MAEQKLNAENQIAGIGQTSGICPLGIDGKVNKDFLPSGMGGAGGLTKRNCIIRTLNDGQQLITQTEEPGIYHFNGALVTVADYFDLSGNAVDVLLNIPAQNLPLVPQGQPCVLVVKKDGSFEYIPTLLIEGGPQLPGHAEENMLYFSTQQYRMFRYISEDWHPYSCVPLAIFYDQEFYVLASLNLWPWESVEGAKFFSFLPFTASVMQDFGFGKLGWGQGSGGTPVLVTDKPQLGPVCLHTNGGLIENSTRVGAVPIFGAKYAGYHKFTIDFMITAYQSETAIFAGSQDHTWGLKLNYNQVALYHMYSGSWGQHIASADISLNTKYTLAYEYNLQAKKINLYLNGVNIFQTDTFGTQDWQNIGVHLGSWGNGSMTSQSLYLKNFRIQTQA